MKKPTTKTLPENSCRASWKCKGDFEYWLTKVKTVNMFRKIQFLFALPMLMVVVECQTKVYPPGHLRLLPGFRAILALMAEDDPTVIRALILRGMMVKKFWQLLMAQFWKQQKKNVGVQQ